MNKKLVAIIEARMTSTRLPGKVLVTLDDKPALEQMILRVRRSLRVHDIVIATTTNSLDQAIVDLAKRLHCRYFQGSEQDVLSRVLGAAQSAGAIHIVGLTGDCPLIDPEQIDKLADFYFDSNIDYAANRLKPGLPDGFDVQIYSLKTLQKTETLTQDPVDRIHVTSFIYQHPELFRVGELICNPQSPEYGPDLSVTLDEPADQLLLNEIFAQSRKQNKFFYAKDIVGLLNSSPELRALNKNVRRKTLHEG